MPRVRDRPTHVNMRNNMRTSRNKRREKGAAIFRVVQPTIYSRQKHET